LLSFGKFEILTKEPIVKEHDSGEILKDMKNKFSKRLGAGFLIVLMQFNVYQAAAAQGFSGSPQLMKDIQVIDKLSKDYNTKTSQDKKRVESILSSFESLMGRKLALSERSFLALQFAAMDVLPRFEVKENTIQVYDMNEGSKDLLVSLEVVDAEKNTFRFGKRTFQVDPQKPIHENIQHILKELQKGEGVSFWQQLNPFAVPQAQAAMATWVKYLLVGAIALVAGIFIGKAIQKNKDKKNQSIAESFKNRINGKKNKIEEIVTGESQDATSEASHETNTSSHLVESSEFDTEAPADAEAETTEAQDIPSGTEELSVV